jgi:ubiquinone/menaquinone biosynthesis C-methylase UbiE
MKKRSRAQEHSDADVGDYYEDPARAEGLARLYEAATPLGEFYRERMRLVAGLLEDVEGTLLDAGCGTGQMIRFLGAERSGRFDFTGVDRSASMIRVARQLVADDDSPAHFHVARIEEMPFADATFDVVLVMGSLEYVAGVDQALAEIARVVRPGGLAIVTMGNPWSPYRLWDATVWSRLRRLRGAVESPVVQRLGERQLRRALVRAGLGPSSVIRYGFNLCPAPLDSRFPGLAVRQQRVLEPVMHGPLRRLATDFLIVAHRIERVGD